MSDIRRPSGEDTLASSFIDKLQELNSISKHHYKITAQYDNFYHSITYYSDKTEDELMREFLLKIRYNQPCFVQDASNNPYNIVNLTKADIIYIELQEED